MVGQPWRRSFWKPISSKGSMRRPQNVRYGRVPKWAGSVATYSQSSRWTWETVGALKITCDFCPFLIGWIFWPAVCATRQFALRSSLGFALISTSLSDRPKTYENGNQRHTWLIYKITKKSLESQSITTATHDCREHIMQHIHTYTWKCIQNIKQ
jgi:hypothetical protein